MDTKSIIGNIFSYAAGILFLGIGIVNTFWGNDMGFGIFIVLLSLVFFLPVNKFAKNIAGIRLPLLITRLLLGAFIIWAALGVGELFDKIDLMKADLFR